MISNHVFLKIPLSLKEITQMTGKKIKIKDGGLYKEAIERNHKITGL